MELVKWILVFQLSCLCRGDPYIHHLADRKCSFTLRLPGNRRHDVVALTSDSADALLQQICQDFDCGGVYRVNKTGSPPGAACFHGCRHQDGGLRNCSKNQSSNCTVIAEVVCGHQAVQLAGGRVRCAGRVELWMNGRWGTVCNKQWDLRDANVVCAQLGCGYALNVKGHGLTFPPGRGPIYLSKLNCIGKEDNLWACPAAQVEPDCGHNKDAGVICSEMRALTGGLDRRSGKVEIHRKGSWGTVCDNCWNRREGSLGFPAGTTANPAATTSWTTGSLGFPAGTTANPAATTSWTTEVSTKLVPTGAYSFWSVELLSTMVPSLVLLVILIVNTLFCCYYRRRQVWLLQKKRTSLQASPEHHRQSYQDAVHLTRINPHSLQMDDPETRNKVMGTFLGYDKETTDAQYARVSKMSQDSSISNKITNGYVTVTLEPGPASAVNDTLDPVRTCSSDQQRQSGDFDSPIYSAVSSDRNPPRLQNCSETNEYFKGQAPVQTEEHNEHQWGDFSSQNKCF